MSFRDRVKELRRVPAKSLQPHPKNWRTHPPRQRKALQAVLTEVGYADALLARELPDGTLQLVDGHLRAETTPEADVPVLVLDLSEEEADKLLAVLDPLAAMADTDELKLDELVSQIETRNEPLQEMLDRLSRQETPLPTLETARPKVREVHVAESYQVLVDCRDEADQHAVYERLTAEGYTCRVLTL